MTDSSDNVVVSSDFDADEMLCDAKDVEISQPATWPAPPVIPRKAAGHQTARVDACTTVEEGIFEEWKGRIHDALEDPLVPRELVTVAEEDEEQEKKAEAGETPEAETSQPREEKVRDVEEAVDVERRQRQEELGGPRTPEPASLGTDPLHRRETATSIRAIGRATFESVVELEDEVKTPQSGQEEVISASISAATAAVASAFTARDTQTPSKSDTEKATLEQYDGMMDSTSVTSGDLLVSSLIYDGFDRLLTVDAADNAVTTSHTARKRAAPIQYIHTLPIPSTAFWHVTIRHRGSGAVESQGVKDKIICDPKTPLICPPHSHLFDCICLRLSSLCYMPMYSAAIVYDFSYCLLHFYYYDFTFLSPSTFWFVFMLFIVTPTERPFMNLLGCSPSPLRAPWSPTTTPAHLFHSPRLARDVACASAIPLEATSTHVARHNACSPLFSLSLRAMGQPATRPAPSYCSPRSHGQPDSPRRVLRPSATPLEAAGTQDARDDACSLLFPSKPQGDQTARDMACTYLLSLSKPRATRRLDACNRGGRGHLRTGKVPRSAGGSSLTNYNLLPYPHTLPLRSPRV
ncbi:hypothetical protein BDN71DRAFT_1510616 [Pleurotus eryngii]|uniref:Uncharacterized protein n=1 Tax=Pleurotus eryngii TaxID=5323 RepID=A0A9P6D4U6_PLEER|nr:hypothetical protein BDN71DRAFT_1510616 [Pleurotus eryngii]